VSTLHLLEACEATMGERHRQRPIPAGDLSSAWQLPRPWSFFCRPVSRALWIPRTSAPA